MYAQADQTSSDARTGFLPPLHPSAPTRAPGTAQPSPDIENVSLAHRATVLPRRTRQPLNPSSTITTMVESQKRRTTRSQRKRSAKHHRFSKIQQHSPTTFFRGFPPPTLNRPSETPVLRASLTFKKSCLTIIEEQGSSPEFRLAVGCAVLGELGKVSQP